LQNFVVAMISWLVIDTDAGVDDAIALSMALQLTKLPEYPFVIKAFTTCFGNVDCPQVIKNVAKVRAANGLSVETGPSVIRGCHEPLTCSRLDATYFHGMDGLGNNSYPDESNNDESNKLTSADYFLQVCAEVDQNNQNPDNNPIELTVVMLGPLTNLAAAWAKDKDTLFRNIAHLVIMGGCGNARGNLTRTTEFNISADPEAAECVFKALEYSTVDTSIVSWELCCDNPFSWDLFDKLLVKELVETDSDNGRLRRFLFDISTQTYGHKQREFLEMNTGAVICDLLAVAVALCGKSSPNSLVEKSRRVNVEVELTGTHTRGQTVVDWGCYDGIKRIPNCNWITNVRMTEYVRMFEKMFDHL
jgi:purine nucleosidase